MDIVEPTQGYDTNITEIILLYPVGSEYVEVYIKQHLGQVAELERSILVAVNVCTWCVRFSVLLFRKVNWAVFRTFKSFVRNISDIMFMLGKM